MCGRLRQLFDGQLHLVERARLGERANDVEGVLALREREIVPQLASQGTQGAKARVGNFGTARGELGAGAQIRDNGSNTRQLVV